MSGGNVVVKVSKASVSNRTPVSPGANDKSKLCAIFEIEIRSEIMAKFLPGHECIPIDMGLAPVARMGF